MVPEFHPLEIGMTVWHMIFLKPLSWNERKKKKEIGV